MLDLGALYGRLTLDTSDWDASLESAHGGLEKLTSVATVAAAAIGATMAAAAGYGLTVAAGMETTQIAFETLLGSAEAAGSYVEKLRADAAATPFEFAGLASSAQRLIGMGLNAEQARLTVLALGDAVSAVGGGSDELARASTAFGQMAAKGKTSMEELQQLAENNIPAVRYLAEGMGVSVAEAMAKVSAGGVDAAEGMKAIVAGIVANSEGAMARQSATLLGRLSTLKDDVGNALGQAFAPLRDVLSQMLGPLTELALTAVDAMAPLVDGAAVAARYVGALLAALNTLSPATKTLALQAAVVGVALLAGAGAMGTFSATAGAVAAPAAQTAAVLGSLGQAASGVVAIVTNAGAVLGPLWSGLSNVGAILTSLVPRVLAWVAAQLSSATASATAAASTGALAAAETAEGVAAVGAATGTGVLSAAVAVLDLVLTPVLVVLAALGAELIFIGEAMAVAAVTVGVLGVAWDANFLGMQDAVYRLWGLITDAFSGIKDAITDSISKALEAVGDAIMEVAPLLDMLGLGGATSIAFKGLNAAQSALSDPSAFAADVLAAAETAMADGAEAIKAALLDLVPSDMRSAFDSFLAGMEGAAASVDDYSHALDAFGSAAGGGDPKAAKKALDYFYQILGAAADEIKDRMSALSGALDPTIASLGALQQAAEDLIAFWSDMGKQAIGSLGDVGGVINDAIEGAKSGGAVGAVAAGGMAALGSSAGFSEIVAQLDAMLAGIMDVLEPLFAGLQPVLKALGDVIGAVIGAFGPVISMVGSIVSMAAPLLEVVAALSPLFAMLAAVFLPLQLILEPLMPILDVAFRVLFEVLAFIAKIILWVMYGLQTAWNAIVGAIAGIIEKIGNALHSDFLISVADGINSMKADTDATAEALDALSNMTYDSAAATANATDATDDMAEAAEAATEALTAVPAGYKVALARFEAMAAEASPSDAAAAVAAVMDAFAQLMTGGGSGSTSASSGRSGPTTGGHRRTSGGRGATYVNIGRASLSASTITDLALSAEAAVTKRRRALSGLPIGTAGRWVGKS